MKYIIWYNQSTRPENRELYWLPVCTPSVTTFSSRFLPLTDALCRLSSLSVMRRCDVDGATSENLITAGFWFVQREINGGGRKNGNNISFCFHDLQTVYSRRPTLGVSRLSHCTLTHLLWTNTNLYPESKAQNMLPNMSLFSFNWSLSSLSCNLLQIFIYGKK